MNQRRFKRFALVALTAGLLTLCVGCVEALVAGGVGTFGLGYILGRTTAPSVTETTCFVNGVEVPCGELPQ